MGHIKNLFIDNLKFILKFWLIKSFVKIKLK